MAMISQCLPRKSLIRQSLYYSSLLGNVRCIEIRSPTSKANLPTGSSPKLTSNYHVAPDGVMNGFILREPGKPLTIEQFRIPRPKADELLIKTKACGVCHSDLHVIKGEIPFPTPCAIGHEITGEVVELGPSTHHKFAERFPIGSRVVGAFIMPCGACFHCSKGHDELCEDFFAFNRAKGTLYDGQTRLFLREKGEPVYMYSMGGLAEYCVVPANALALLPKTLPYSESSILGCAVFTAYGAIAHAAQIRPGESVAIVGTGGVGSSCVQIAKAFGASEVIAVDVSDDKLEKAKAMGADHTVNSAKEDAVETIRGITGGRGVDVAVEALGKPVTFSECIRSVRDGGKAVMVGLAQAGLKGEIDINHLVRRKIQVIGSYGARARHDLPNIVKLAERGAFNVGNAVSRRYKFEAAADAFDDLNNGRIVGRGVVEIM